MYHLEWQMFRIHRQAASVNITVIYKYNFGFAISPAGRYDPGLRSTISTFKFFLMYQVCAMTVRGVK